MDVLLQKPTRFVRSASCESKEGEDWFIRLIDEFKNLILLFLVNPINSRKLNTNFREVGESGKEMFLTKKEAFQFSHDVFDSFVGIRFAPIGKSFEMTVKGDNVGISNLAEVLLAKIRDVKFPNRPDSVFFVTTFTRVCLNPLFDGNVKSPRIFSAPFFGKERSKLDHGFNFDLPKMSVILTNDRFSIPTLLDEKPLAFVSSGELPVTLTVLPDVNHNRNYKQVLKESKGGRIGVDQKIFKKEPKIVSRNRRV